MNIRAKNKRQRQKELKIRKARNVTEEDRKKIGKKVKREEDERVERT